MVELGWEVSGFWLRSAGGFGLSSPSAAICATVVDISEGSSGESRLNRAMCILITDG